MGRACLVPSCLWAPRPVMVCSLCSQSPHPPVGDKERFPTNTTTFPISQHYFTLSYPVQEKGPTPHVRLEGSGPHRCTQWPRERSCPLKPGYSEKATSQAPSLFSSPIERPSQHSDVQLSEVRKADSGAYAERCWTESEIFYLCTEQMQQRQWHGKLHTHPT